MIRNEGLQNNLSSKADDAVGFDDFRSQQQLVSYLHTFDIDVVHVRQRRCAVMRNIQGLTGQSRLLNRNCFLSCEIFRS